MKLNTSGKLCPICQKENEESSSICVHCGAQLDEKPTRLVTIPENLGKQANAPVEHMGSLIDVSLIPEGGLGIYVAGEFKPHYMRIDKELVIGRLSEGTAEALLDLSSFNAVNLGVSRRHVMIRRTDSGYEVVDLASRNGTWLNAERLVPNKSYPFVSGSQLRIGQMRLLIMYHPVPKST